MGGAERIVCTTAKQAVSCGLYDQVDIFVLCQQRSGTLDELGASDLVNLQYTEADNELGGVLPLARFVQQKKYALVFSSSTHLNAYASLLRRVGLLRADRLVTRESTEIFERDFGAQGYLLRALYWFYGAQDLIICQTGRMRESLDRHTRGRLSGLIKTLPNPVDIQRIEAGKSDPIPLSIDAIPADRIKIVWCGRLSPVKSPHRAVEVMRCLQDAGETQMHLVIVGDGPLREALEEQVSRSKLSDFVTFAGHHRNPAGIMSQCDYGLLTSDTEGFPNVILEMLASGVRGVVTTDCAGDLEQIPATVVVEGGDNSPGALAHVIRKSSVEANREGLPGFMGKRCPKTFFDNMLL